MEGIMKKCVLILLVLCLANIGFTIKLADLPTLERPALIKVEGDELFVADGHTIHVYSLKNYQLKFKLGKRGEGPGEFKYQPGINILPDHLLITSGRYCVWFSRDGKMVKDKKTVGRKYFPIPVKENYAALKLGFDIQTEKMTRIYILLNPQLEEIKEVYKLVADVNILNPNDPPTKEYKMLLHYNGVCCHDDKIFIADTQKGFFIDVFDFNGKHLYTIDKNSEVEKVTVSDSYKKRCLDMFKIIQKDIWERRNKSSFTFYKYFPSFESFLVDNKKIYVITYKEKGDKNEIIILDLKGNILDRVFVPLKSKRIFKFSGEYDPNTVHKGRLYEIIENDETEMWELHKTDLSSVKE